MQNVSDCQVWIGLLQMCQTCREVLKCWNCDTEIQRAENWTPLNKVWIENPEGAARPHDFKKCYSQKKARDKDNKPSPKSFTTIEYAGRWAAPEWVIKHYQSINEFERCVFPDCFCKTIEKWIKEQFASR